MDWIVPTVDHGNYISDDRLKNVRAFILVTYRTPHGRRYVKQVECMHGLVTKKLGGRIIAWMPLPDPYRGGK